MSRKDTDDVVDDESRPRRPGFPIDLTRILRALLRGKWWLAAAAVIGGLSGYLIAKYVVQHTYESTASLRYEGFPGGDVGDAQRELPSLVSVAHSAAIMTPLRERMDLEEASLDLMQRMVQVQSDPGSGLVSFTTTGDSPERAAEMANAVVQVFLDYHRERRGASLSDEIRSLGERLEAGNTQLAEARRVYDTFREGHGITDLTVEQEQAIEQAADLRSQADLARADIEGLEARVRQLQGALSRTPRTQTVTAGPSTQRQRLTELQQRLREARAQGLGEEHPMVASLATQVETLESQGTGGSATRSAPSGLYDQLSGNLSTARTELEATRQRHVSLEQLAVAAQARTNRFSTIEGQAAGLLAQVNVKQALVNELSEQKARIEDQLRDIQTGFRVVSEGRPPESAVPTKRKWAVALGLPFVFVSIMMSMLVYRELRGFLVQTPVEVAFWGNGPVIGTTTWPRNPRALLDLIADMDDFAPEATGTMLVLGVNDAERELAGEIAAQLNHDWSSTTLIDVPVLGILTPGGDHELPPPTSEGYLDDDPISGEIHDGPTELSLAHGSGLALYDGPTEISSYVAGELGAEVEDLDGRLVCTAWSGSPEGQALRRAARLADRVLVVVTSNAHKATALAGMGTRLGRDQAVGFVLIGVTDATSKLPDRAGPVEAFWRPAKPPQSSSQAGGR